MNVKDKNPVHSSQLFAFKIHGLEDLTSDSDVSLTDDILYNVLNPPPLPYELIRDKIVLVDKCQLDNKENQLFPNTPCVLDQSVSREKPSTPVECTVSKKKRKKKKKAKELLDLPVKTPEWHKKEDYVLFNNKSCTIPIHCYKEFPSLKSRNSEKPKLIHQTGDVDVPKQTKTSSPDEHNIRQHIVNLDVKETDMELQLPRTYRQLFTNNNVKAVDSERIYTDYEGLKFETFASFKEKYFNATETMIKSKSNVKKKAKKSQTEPEIELSEKHFLMPKDYICCYHDYYVGKNLDNFLSFRQSYLNGVVIQNTTDHSSALVNVYYPEKDINSTENHEDTTQLMPLLQFINFLPSDELLRKLKEYEVFCIIQEQSKPIAVEDKLSSTVKDTDETKKQLGAVANHYINREFHSWYYEYQGVNFQRFMTFRENYYNNILGEIRNKKDLNNEKNVISTKTKAIRNMLENHDNSLQVFTEKCTLEDECDKEKSQDVSQADRTVTKRKKKNPEIYRQLFNDNIKSVDSDRGNEPIYTDYRGLELETFASFKEKNVKATETAIKSKNTVGNPITKSNKKNPEIYRQLFNDNIKSVDSDRGNEPIYTDYRGLELETFASFKEKNVKATETAIKSKNTVTKSNKKNPEIYQQLFNDNIKSVDSDRGNEPIYTDYRGLELETFASFKEKNVKATETVIKSKKKVGKKAKKSQTKPKTSDSKIKSGEKHFSIPNDYICCYHDYYVGKNLDNFLSFRQSYLNGVVIQNTTDNHSLELVNDQKLVILHSTNLKTENRHKTVVSTHSNTKAIENVLENRENSLQLFTEKAPLEDEWEKENSQNVCKSFHIVNNIEPQIFATGDENILVSHIKNDDVVLGLPDFLRRLTRIGFTVFLSYVFSTIFLPSFTFFLTLTIIYFFFFIMN